MAQKNIRITQLLSAAALTLACGWIFLFAFKANENLVPVLPPLAAERHLHNWLYQTPQSNLVDGDLYHHQTVSEIYQRTGYKMLWFNNYQLSDAGKSLLQQLQETSADDLHNYRYHLTYLQQRLGVLTNIPKEATALDILFTDAFVSYAEDVLSEKLLPENLARSRRNFQKVIYNGEDSLIAEDDYHSRIVHLIETNPPPKQLQSVLHHMTPKHPSYTKLRDAMANYRRIAKDTRWQPIPSGPTLRQGDQHPQVVQLRTLLKLYGDYPLPQKKSLFSWLGTSSMPDEPKQPERFDRHLAESLKHFLSRHGIKTDKVLDQKARELLNTNPSHRIRQIALNMKRFRALPNELGERYLWVNLTNFRLQMIDNEKVSMDMKVIVGKTYRRTPVLQQQIMDGIVLNPDWNVPQRITLYDLLPKIKKDPEYLTRKNFEILKGWQEPKIIPADEIDWPKASRHNFPYRLRQAPGEDNALGMIKFVLDNDQSIYLHDTNQPNLFQKDYRALSSGCIRVEQPRKLAAALLQSNKRWHRDKIEQTIALGNTKYVRLPEPIPVYLTYFTAWIDQDGFLQFRDDIYNKDQLQASSQTASTTL